MILYNKCLNTDVIYYSNIDIQVDLKPASFDLAINCIAKTNNIDINTDIKDFINQ
jgi:hypothetical protein